MRVVFTPWTSVLLLLLATRGREGNRDSIPGPRQEERKWHHCSEEISTSTVGSNVAWPETPAVLDTTVTVTSTPLCLAADRSLLSRRCVMDDRGSAAWIPPSPPVCAGTQTPYQFFDKCPPPYKEVHSSGILLCLLITSPQPWYPVCLTSGSTKSVLDLQKDQLNTVLEILARSGVTSVWLTVRRYGRYGPLLRKLPGESWGKKFENNKEFFVPWEPGRRSLDEKCLKLNLAGATSNITLETENCYKLIPAVCVLQPSQDDLLLPLSCPEGYQTSRYGLEQRRCFKAEQAPDGVTWQQAENTCSLQGHLMTVSSAHVNHMSTILMQKESVEDRCWMGLTRHGPDSEYTWRGNRSASLDYVNWSPETDFGNTRGAILADGSWELLGTSATLRCFLCEAQAQPLHAELFLRLHRKVNLLRLSVVSGDGLWKASADDPGFQCFTDAAGDFVRKVKVQQRWKGRWTLDDVRMFRGLQPGLKHRNLSLDIRKIVYELQPKNKAGNYWCEGFRVSSFQLMRSNTVLVFGRKPGFIFALVLDVLHKCVNVANATFCDPTFSTVYKWIAKDVRNRMRDKASQKVVADVRPMLVLDVNDDGTVRLLLHIRITCDGNDLEDAYRRTLTIAKEFAVSNSPAYTFQSLRSTSGCLPENTKSADGGVLTWTFTQFGATAVPAELCVGQDGLPIRRRCLGDFISGGYWESPSGECLPTAPSLTTRSLFALATDSGVPGRTDIADIAENITALAAVPSTLSPADVWYLAMVMRNLAQLATRNTTQSEGEVKFELQVITEVMDKVNRAPDEVVETSQNHLNSTNILLEALDDLLDHISLTSNHSKEDGVLLAVTSQIVVQISDPSYGNVSGLALIRKNTSEQSYYGEDSNAVTAKQDFTNFTAIQLKADQSLDSVLNMNAVEVAVWVPDELITKLTEENNVTENETVLQKPGGNYVNIGPSYRLVGRKPRIVIVLFYRDLIFHCAPDAPQVASRIVSVSIPGFGSDLPIPIPIVFRPMLDGSHGRECSFWDFSYNSSTPSTSRGGWTGDGCVLAGSSRPLDVCVCTHLTHFAELITDPSSLLEYVDEDVLSLAVRHQKALDVITMLGCAMSLLGVAGIAATAVVFRAWREKASTKVLLQLSAAVSLQMIILLLADLVSPSSDITALDSSDNLLLSWERDAACIALGAALHYSVLAAFSWMLVTAFLQFLRYVRVLGNTRPTRFLLKSMLVGWGVPAVPVAVVLGANPSSYIPRGASTLCYPSGLAFYLGVVLPVAGIVAANLAVFVLVLNSVLRGPDGHVRAPTDRSLLASQLRLSVLLFFLLGLSWLFGLLSLSGAGIIFSYLFCLTATLQGFVLFLFFVVCDPSTRQMWVSLASKCGHCSVRFSGSPTSSSSQNSQKTSASDLVG